MNLIHLMRHGQIVQHPDRPFVGNRDIPLDDTGHTQAATAAAALAAIPFQRIIASDLSRCLATANPIAAPHNLTPEPTPALREINLGSWQGLTSAQVRDLYPAEYAQRAADLANTRPSNGESFADLADRVWPVFTRLAAWAAANGPILIVAHSAVNKVILARILDMPLANVMRLAQDYACLNVIGHNAWGYELLTLNHTFA